MSIFTGSVAVIFARGGSRGLPSLIDFAGKPLLAWSILQSLATESVRRVYVSSDSQAILDVAKQYGACPIRCPEELATDGLSSEVALGHALDVITRDLDAEPDHLVFLQATSPLREPSDIDGAVAAFLAQGVDSLFSDAVLDDFYAWQEEGGVLKGKTFDSFKRDRCEDRNPLYLENGSIYVFKTALLRQTGNRLGGVIGRYSMSFWKSFVIDTFENLELCEYYFRRHLLSYWQAREGVSAFRPDLIVYDFDGVMTDNRVLVLQDGSEAVLANRADGWGIGQLKQVGFAQIILSTETNPVVAVRARKLGLEVLQGSGDKRRDLLAYCEARKVPLEKVMYVGNDVNDLEAMQTVGFPVAPADAHAEILAMAKYVTKARGGEGVVKELSEMLLAHVTQ